MESWSLFIFLAEKIWKKVLSPETPCFYETHLGAQRFCFHFVAQCFSSIFEENVQQRHHANRTNLYVQHHIHQHLRYPISQQLIDCCYCANWELSTTLPAVVVLPQNNSWLVGSLQRIRVGLALVIPNHRKHKPQREPPISQKPNQAKIKTTPSDWFEMNRNGRFLIWCPRRHPPNSVSVTHQQRPFSGSFVSIITLDGQDAGCHSINKDWIDSDDRDGELKWNTINELIWLNKSRKPSWCSGIISFDWAPRTRERW